MKFYSAHSAHGSLSSHGFSNDTVVLIWSTKKDRDDFLQNCNNLSAQKINRNEATKYATNFNMSRNEYSSPVPFSGEYWGIDDCNPQDIIGLVGQLVCCDALSNCDRFYN